MTAFLSTKTFELRLAFGNCKSQKYGAACEAKSASLQPYVLLTVPPILVGKLIRVLLQMAGITFLYAALLKMHACKEKKPAEQTGQFYKATAASAQFS
jgi:hypothetical protein